MTIIKVLRIFIQEDKNSSLQRNLKGSNKTSNQVNKYFCLVKIADKIKSKQRLDTSEIFLAARFYRSLTNELKGKTMRYEIARENN